MGDVVLQTATINWLRSLYGAKLRLTFVTSKEFASLIDSHPDLDQVVTFDRRGGESWSDFTQKLKALHQQHPIDLLFDLHGTMRSLRLRISFWYIPALVADKRRIERFLLTKIKFGPIKRLIDVKTFGLEPQVERIINDVESLFFDNRGVRRTQDYVRGTHQELTNLSRPQQYSIDGSYVVLAPSASFPSKRWPVDSFVELAKKLLHSTQDKVIILAGPGDEFCKVFDAIPDKRLVNLQGKTSLKESMAILSKAICSIGNDSGMNHIAEAYGVPCLTIFGPTDPRFGFAPHGSQSYFLSKNLSCKPCSTTGSKACTRERLYCMEEISVDEVFNTYLKMRGQL